MHEDQHRQGIDLPGPAHRVSAAFIRWAAALFFGFVTFIPIFRRLRHPTILGDDITRIVDVVKYPFREHLFLPFAEHIAPLFQLVTWLTWEAIGHDVRLAPLGYSAASVLSWMLVLGLLGFWLWRKTGSRTAALVAVALAAQSPLVLETAWWYSASSFLWAIAGILIAILGASFLARRPVMALLVVGIGSGLGLAGTTLGILAGPVAIVRGLVDRSASRWKKVLVIVAAVGGVFTYRQICKVGGVTVFHADPRSALPGVDARGGLFYALTVPGRVLWPSLVGVPVSREIMPQPLWLSVGAGAVVLALTAALAFWPKAPWNRRQVLVGAAMIYGCYLLTYSARTHMLKTGQWTEPQFLYQFASRYHVLPLLGSVTILATLLASWPLIRRLDARRGAAALLAAVVGLATMFVQEKESSFWNWMLDQPDQKTTLAAVNHVGDLARDQGVTRAQLMRIFDPVRRPWNGSVMNDRPYAFHLMNLAVQAPAEALRPVPDDEAPLVCWRRCRRKSESHSGPGHVRFTCPNSWSRRLARSRSGGGLTLVTSLSMRKGGTDPRAGRPISSTSSTRCPKLATWFFRVWRPTRTWSSSSARLPVYGVTARTCAGSNRREPMPRSISGG